ncbi:hypothetical protein RSAG8_10617, partial [Rhizoctonia solani AG-8 WAC10335]
MVHLDIDISLIQSGLQPFVFGVSCFTSLRTIVLQFYGSGDICPRIPALWMEFVISSIAASPALASMHLSQTSLPDMMLALEACKNEPSLKDFQAHCHPRSETDILRLCRLVIRRTTLTRLEIAYGLLRHNQPAAKLQLRELCWLCIDAPPNYITLLPLSAEHVSYLKLIGDVWAPDHDPSVEESSKGPAFSEEVYCSAIAAMAKVCPKITPCD